jgi:CRP/FNR family transcriptional regulator, anaerobic regulatory protein
MTQHNIIDLLHNTPGVSEISVPTDTTVCQQGDACQNLVVVVQGQVRVFRPAEDGRSITLYHIASGEACILTAACILNCHLFPAIAVVSQEVTGLSVPGTLVRQWLRDTPWWRDYVFTLLSERMGDLISLVDALAFGDLEARLGRWLLDHVDARGDIYITHRQIAEALASSREVISRLLKELERREAIVLSRGRIQLIAPNKISLM